MNTRISSACWMRQRKNVSAAARRTKQTFPDSRPIVVIFRRGYIRGYSSSTANNRGQKKNPGAFDFQGFRVGAGNVTRTHDLLITNQLLYRLSYTSICSTACYTLPYVRGKVKIFLRGGEILPAGKDYYL